MAKSKTSPTGSRPAPSSRPPATDPPGQGLSVRHPAALIAAGALVVAVLAYLIFLALGSDADRGPAAAPDLEHVHGLGVDPGDGTLYAGTHYGLFRLPEGGRGARVADRVQDFMGFTVAGPRHFLASGHPGAGQDGPSSVGLIESTDGGESWQQVSLAGEADFHALEYRHDRVYGVNAMTGEFMVSADLRTWDTRTRLPMADFAVSPDDTDVVLATTEEGVARSDDGGRTFALVQGAPLLLLLSWADDGLLVGVGPEGNVAVSADQGATWEARATLDGYPEAMAAVTEDEIYVAVAGSVLESTDGAREFTVRFPE